MRFKERNMHTYSCQGKQGKKVYTDKTSDNQWPLTASSVSSVGGKLGGAKCMLCQLMASLDEQAWPRHWKGAMSDEAGEC